MEPLVTVPTLPGPPIRIPPQLEGLRRMAYNLWWAWHADARRLFARVDPDAWTRHHSPVSALLSSVDWVPLLADPRFMAEYDDLLRRFDAYLAGGSDHWFARKHGHELPGPIAYFCAEYGLHESIGIYSGGLGVLAGDHTKTASDMAIPFVGVGLLYRNGYFRQTIDADGHQEHAYPDYDPATLPILPVADATGGPLRVPVELPGRTVSVAVWRAQVGRTPVLLLDTYVPDNSEADRPITHILYVRGREMRLHQELVLGVGGVRALRALGISPVVWHLNEGHSAFLLAERARELVAAGGRVDDAFAAVKNDSVFTIHTPVSAGNERFDADLVRRVAGPLFDGDGRPGTGGVPISTILDLGLGVEGDRGQFDMTSFSLRLTKGSNAVSRLHARTANATWHPIIDEPILAVTNGVHAPSWVGVPMRELYERYLDADLDDLDGRTNGSRFWDKVGRLPDKELWEAHIRQKRDLTHFARGRLLRQLARHGEAPSVLADLETELEPEILTIGFARRFATYKRASLIFRDMDRLARLIDDPDRPVQFIFAGKAHPADRPGQQVIQDIFGRSRGDRLRGRVFILEDYDMRIARYLVQGVDVWMNTPRRPLEASGTSGMKAAQNGVLNLSVLDGWWDEGWTGDNGWAIGGRETDPDEGAQDYADALDLYRLLETEVVPRYYERDANGVPRAWLQLVRSAIASTIWRFSTTRMLHEYVERLYLPAAGVPLPESSTGGAPHPVTEAG